ncbi:MAG: hypothetical protein NZ455_02755 [Bacteroidia bacterium]|nr:hypothetical protein [Bacteroidia bacterium]
MRSAAKHRSNSAARSTPTLPTQAQAKCGQGHAQKNELLNPDVSLIVLSKYFLSM